MRAKQTLNQSMTDATLQSTPINVTDCYNAIRKGTVVYAHENSYQRYIFTSIV